jgi:hypothetical protein
MSSKEFDNIDFYDLDYKQLEEMRKRIDTPPVYNRRFPTKPNGTSVVSRLSITAHIDYTKDFQVMARDRYPDPRENTKIYDYDLQYLTAMKDNYDELYDKLDKQNNIVIPRAGAEFDGTATWRQLLERYFWEGAKLRKPSMSPRKSMSPGKSKDSKGGSRKKRGTRRHNK